MAISNVLHTVWHLIFFRALDEVFADYPGTAFQVRLWNGTTWSRTSNPKFTVILNTPEALRRLFVHPSEVGIGEAYIAGFVDVEGDMQAAFELGDYLLCGTRACRISQLLLTVLGKMPYREEAGSNLQHHPLHGTIHSKSRDSQAIRYHYDLPPDFFALWLDRRMIYSCAYFADGNHADLDAAQNSKLHYISKQLRLRPGERLLDIGCGWGGFIVHAAAEYGVQAHGVTLSLRQAEVARKRSMMRALTANAGLNCVTTEISNQTVSWTRSSVLPLHGDSGMPLIRADWYR